MSFVSKFNSELRNVAIIAVAAFAVFANTLGGNFVYDDKRQILQNPLIQSSELYSRALRSDVWAFKGSEKFAGSNYWRPTFTAWSIVNFRLFGTSPFGWHLTNVLLHIAACLLAYFLLLQWRIPKTASLLITLLFAVHPVHVESVAWISGSPDLLMAAALLGSFLLIRREGGSRSRRYAFAALLFAVALGAKEVAIAALPVYALIFGLREDDQGETEGWRFDVRSTKFVAPFAAIAGLYLAARQKVIGSFALPVDDAASFSSAILTAPAAFLFYIRQSLFPYWLGPNYPLRPVESFDVAGFLAPLLLVLALLLVVWLVVKKSRIALIGAAIFVCLLAPAMYISAFPREQIVHDRYLYLSLFGLLIVGYYAPRPLIDRSAKAARSIGWATAAVTLALGIQTISYNSVWASDAALWRHAVKIDPNSASNWQQFGAEGGGIDAVAGNTGSVQPFDRDQKDAACNRRKRAESLGCSSGRRVDRRFS
jgi:protein O-mannosyl-transferase